MSVTAFLACTEMHSSHLRAKFCTCCADFRILVYKGPKSVLKLKIDLTKPSHAMHEDLFITILQINEQQIALFHLFLYNLSVLGQIKRFFIPYAQWVSLSIMLRELLYNTSKLAESDLFLRLSRKRVNQALVKLI